MNRTLVRTSIVFGLALCSALVAIPLQAETAAPAMLGFRADGAARTAALEQRFDAALKADDQRAWLEEMAAQPNHVGSPHDKANAERMLALFRSWGWDARIETYKVLFPTPRERLLELTAPTTFRAKLEEPTLAEDRTSGVAGKLPTYNAYSADGDVSGELVYVNYGIPDDYDQLARMGIDVKGKIVIARYGHSWRGIKPVVAYEHGAIGCIIYSDPQGDGYFEGDAYPKGAFRPADGVQRGSVAKMQIYPGDPLTPNVGATEDAKRLPLSEAETVLKIPVLPISYADAQPLLAALGGQVVPEGWRGALPLTYHLGPGPARVHLKLAFDWKLEPIYDVVATMTGSEFPDEWIMRGNHHDGWVFGAADPLSGNVALMAEMKALGELHRRGWRPKRTVVYASWDGEEPGLLGSTEWAEQHADELSHKLAVYINTDGSGRGFLSAGGAHSLQRLIEEVAAGVTDPETKVSVLERVRARALAAGWERGVSEEQRKLAKRLRDGEAWPLYATDPGPDYTVFEHHLGIASLNMAYGGEDDGGDYHSIYDSIDHFERFGDPGFAYGVVLAQTDGHTVLRLADAEVLPLHFGEFADTVARYGEELHKLVDDARSRAQEQSELLDQHAFALAADPTKAALAPPPDARVPFVDFAPLDNALATLKRAATAYDAALAARLSGGSALSRATRAQLDGLLRGAEHQLTDAAGLPHRPWFRNTVYAPGLYTGYAFKTLPGVREAIEQKRWDQVDPQVVTVAAALSRYAADLDAARALLAAR